MDRIEPIVLAEWMAFASIEPFGEERMDQRFRILAAWIVNAVRLDGDIHPDDIQFYESEDPETDQPVMDHGPTEADVFRDMAEQAQFR